MTRFWVPIIGAGILALGLLIGGVIVLGSVLPTKQLTYVASQSNRSDLYLLDLYHRIQVDLIKEAFTPAWSPDGERLAFNSTRDGGSDLYIMDVYTQHLQRLTNNGANNASPAWSPDGRKIAFAWNHDDTFAIYTMAVDCKDSFERCAKRPTPTDNYWYSAPAWSPDGKHIAFVSNRDTTNPIADSPGNANIYIMNRDGTNSHRVTENLGEDYTPAWSPDSRSIIYAAQNIQFGTMELMVLDTQCTTACTRSLLSNVVASMPAWSNDGSSIVFVDVREGNFEIYTTDTQGCYSQRLTYNYDDESSPRWRP